MTLIEAIRADLDGMEARLNRRIAAAALMTALLCAAALAWSAARSGK